MDIQALAQSVRNGERRGLARALTLGESARADHRIAAAELLEALAQGGKQALRIGLSGTPGVGKSTFIESFGMNLIAKGLRVAVLAVDPSSTRSGEQSSSCSPFICALLLIRGLLQQLPNLEGLRCAGICALLR